MDMTVHCPVLYCIHIQFLNDNMHVTQIRSLTNSSKYCQPNGYSKYKGTGSKVEVQ